MDEDISRVIVVKTLYYDVIRQNRELAAEVQSLKSTI